MHDATRHVQGLRLSLAQDKAPLGLLLAAGCSAGTADADGKPLIPAITGMSTALSTHLLKSDHADAFTTLVTSLKEDGTEDPNVEDWLSMVRALRVVAAGAPVRGLTRAQLDALEEAIASAIVKLVDRDLPEDTAFHAVAAWASGVERDLPVEVFTTNYDLLIEQAFESMRSPFFDGFVGVRRPFFDNASVLASTDPPLPSRFTRLWKLHGSVNWFLMDGGDVVRATDQQGPRRLIHPSHLKYDESRQMPYLALLDRLRGFLAQRSALLVTCGYSYRDGHINSVLGEALAGNATANLIALMRGRLETYPEAATLARRHPNMALFARDEAVIGTRRGSWQAETEGPLTGVCFSAEDPPIVTVTLGEFERFGEVLTELLGVPHGDAVAS